MKKTLLVWGIITGILGIAGLASIWYVGLILLVVSGFLIFLYIRKKKNFSTQNNVSDPIRHHNSGAIFEKKTVNDPFVKMTAFKRIIAIDTETTGLSNARDRIIEIGAAVFGQGSDPIDRFSTLINPGILIPVEASSINHITNEMVQSAPSEKEAMIAFVGFVNRNLLEDTSLLFVAHNATFDIGFLEAALNRHGLSLTGYYVDTLQAARKQLPNLENHKLGTVAEFYGIENPTAHRAQSDAEVCGHIFRHIASAAIHNK